MTVDLPTYRPQSFEMVTKFTRLQFQTHEVGYKTEYDFSVEHCPGTKMRHADALSRNVNMITEELVLSKEVIRDEQEKDELCVK